MINVTRTDLPELEALLPYLERIWEKNWVTNDGEFLRELESRLASYLGISELAVVSNGTQALHLAVKVLGLEGEVITTPFTFATTTNVLVWEGLTPVFADIDPRTLCIDPEDVRRKITPETSAILGVHVYGNPCDIKALESIARENELALVFDAAHAFGVEYEGRPVFECGDISATSFHATKVYNTIEGGAVISTDASLLQSVKDMRNHGIVSEEEVVLPGTNAKMSEVLAAVGLCNLDEIDDRISARQARYEAYKELLGDVEGVSFQEVVASRYNYSYMPVLFSEGADRDRACSALLAEDVKARKYFCPLTSDFSFVKEMRDGSADLGIPTAEDVARRVLCLPLYPSLPMEDLERIARIVRKAEGCD